MSMGAALILIVMAVASALQVSPGCQKSVQCPCGDTGQNFTICLEEQTTDDPCKQWAACEGCADGTTGCLECPEGQEGPRCAKVQRLKRSRQKRQYQQYPSMSRRQWPNQRGNRIGLQGYPVAGGCPDIDSPKLGSIRCMTGNGQRTCTGTCLPGYSFENREQETEIQLRCQNGVWTPFRSFPPCKSGGHCDLVVEGHGSFNCTTGMGGTRCDVYCAHQYVGQYFCYPGRRWEPQLPQCVRPKGGDIPAEVLQPCRCEYGGSCDRNGNCVCPVGRTGTYCESIVPERLNCFDPGFIANGHRRNMDGSESTTRRPFEDGESVVFGCNAEGDALQGSAFLTCNNGQWSAALPKCIKPAVTPEVTCPDPGQVANADRLNSDGSPSLGLQPYRIGQSVAYTCRPGFALQRRSLITCQARGTWSNSLPYCTPINPPTPGRTTPTGNPNRGVCRDPGVNPNGIRKPVSAPNRRGFPPGSRLEYSCSQNYDLEGERNLFCLVSGIWSAEIPTCKEQSRSQVGDEYCFNPGSIENGRVVYYPNINSRRGAEDSLDEPEYPTGSRLQYSCDTGYTLEGVPSLVCLGTGEWTDDPPTCAYTTDELTYCNNPGPITNGQRVYLPDLNTRTGSNQNMDDPEYPQGTRFEYSCNSGYVLVGAALITCEDNGSWSADRPTCRRGSSPSTLVYCANPGSIVNGQVQYYQNQNVWTRPQPADDLEYPVGSRLQYSCNSGFNLEGTASLICQSSGRWSADRPTCTSETSSGEHMHCDNPGSILDGWVTPILPNGSPEESIDADSVLEYPEGTRLQYSCEDDYTMTGSSELTCLFSGEWSADPPTCSTECGVSFMQTTRRIIHGNKTEAGEWPWVVAIEVQENGAADIVCGGAVLNSQTVVTAAHCLVADTFTLYFGKLHRSVSKDDSKVMVRQSTRVIRHPDFDSATFDSDIGLIIFSPRIRFTDRVQPICMPSFESTAKNLMTGRKGYVTGWGLTERSLPADELLLAQLPYLTNEECIEAYRRQELLLNITQNMICAGFHDGQQAACSGDSGSPLVFYDSVAKRHILEGLVSFGVRGQCGLPGRYTVFTKVYRFGPWILRNLS